MNPISFSIPNSENQSPFFRSKEARVLGVFLLLFWIPRLAFLAIEKDSHLLWIHFFSPVFLLRTLFLDFAFLSYTLLPLWALRTFAPKLRTFTHVLEGILLFVVLFSTISEPIFMHDMEARYNFIAVDYVVYTHEVLDNVWQSYPVLWILAGIAVLYTTLLMALHRIGKPGNFNLLTGPNLRARLPVFAGLIAAITIFHFAVTEDRILVNASIPTQELAKNGTYALFAAYRNNSLDFERFYRGISPEVAQRIENEEVLKRRKSDIAPKDVLTKPFSHQPNVVLVLMESMSSKFLGVYGGTEKLTPNLDRLSKDGLWFSHVFATGTRTVRGIEAVMLSLPPTPGQSIVRRPDGTHLYNLGTEFQDRGYRTSFVYGGHGYFDNMGPFFSSNGFDVVDQGNFEKSEVTFTTAWGVCDEDLFGKSIKEADLTHEHGKPFFQFILTTSNHRPYRYPDGRVGIQSGVVRQGAIAYSDYAIGKFLDDAKTHAWFNDTIFIFVADHNASVAGGSGVLPRDYLIPLIFYSPGHLKPFRVSEMGSQVDVGPTLYDLLGWKFDEKRFFGSSLISHPSREAFFGTYQNIGRMQENRFVLLSPKKKVEEFIVDEDLNLKDAAPNLTAGLSRDAEETISDYTIASRRYTSGGLKIIPRKN